MKDDFDLDKDASVDSDPKKKKSAKKKFIIISASIAAVLILLTLVVIFLFSKGYIKGTAEEQVPPELIIKNEKNLLFENILHMGEISITLSGMSGGKTLKISIDIELVDPETKEELIKRSVQVKSYIENLLISKTVNEVSTTDGKIILRNEIIRKLNNTLETGKVRNIYFTDFIII